MSDHNERATRLLAVMQAGKRGELGPDVALLAEAYAELSGVICWETDCVHLARAMDVLASAMRERDELKAIEAAAREYRAAEIARGEWSRRADAAQAAGEPCPPLRPLADAVRVARAALDALLAPADAGRDDGAGGGGR